MIKVLYANTQYPDRYNSWAPWNKLANEAVSLSGIVEPEIVVPRPYTLPFRFFPQHQAWNLPDKVRDTEGMVHYPRFPYLLPKKYFYAATFDLYRHFVGNYVHDHIGKKDLVHAHFVYLDGYGMTGTCKRWGVPLIVDVHGDAIFTEMVHDPLVGKKMAETLNFSTRIVCISKNLVRLAKAFGLDEEKLAFIPLGIDTDRFKPRNKERIREEYAVREPKVVLFVGQLSRKKGVFDLLRAIRMIGDRGDCRFVIVGNGPDRDDLVRLAKELGLEGHVTFTGPLSGNTLQKWYSLADIFVLPSWTEGRPTVINEAMASGCAVVATNISGIPEQVRDGHNGLLVAPGDPAMLAGKIARLLDSPEEATAMGRNGRGRIFEEGWTWENYARSTTKLYDSVL